jgi:hypothetical protein
MTGSTERRRCRHEVRRVIIVDRPVAFARLSNVRVLSSASTPNAGGRSTKEAEGKKNAKAV